MPFEIDNSQWPITIMTGVGEGTSDDVTRYLEIQDKVIARRQPHVLIWDVRRGSQVKPSLRRRLTAWIKENEDALSKYRIGFAFVSSSFVLRGMSKAVLSIVSQPYPYKFFNELEEAITWANEMLAKCEGE
jgi:hypothetical protein